MSLLTALFPHHDQYRRADRRTPLKVIRRRNRLISTCLRVEALEERNLLSSHFPLDPVQWTALGPEPVVASPEMMSLSLRPWAIA